MKESDFLSFIEFLRVTFMPPTKNGKGKTNWYFNGKHRSNKWMLTYYKKQNKL
jgi:hypothetical protein